MDLLLTLSCPIIRDHFVAPGSSRFSPTLTGAGVKDVSISLTGKWRCPSLLSGGRHCNRASGSGAWCSPAMFRAAPADWLRSRSSSRRPDTVRGTLRLQRSVSLSVLTTAGQRQVVALHPHLPSSTRPRVDDSTAPTRGTGEWDVSGADANGDWRGRYVERRRREGSAAPTLGDGEWDPAAHWRPATPNCHHRLML